MRIIFTDIRHREVGMVTFDGGTLTANNEVAQAMIDSYPNMAPEDWFEKFSNWSSGYLFSERLD